MRLLNNSDDKLKVFLFIVLIIISFFLCYNVDAAIITYPESYFSFNRVDDFPYTVNNGSSYRMEYTFPETGQYGFLELLVCTEGEYYNFTIVSDACNTSCFEPGKVQYYVKNKCTINGNTNGYLVNLQIRVKKSEYLAVDGMYRTINQITLNGTGKTRIEGYYGSDTDELSVLIADRENTESIIDNDNDNTQAIIDNDNDNTQAIIDSNKVCNSINKDKVNTSGYLNSSGTLNNDSNWGVTDYISIFNDSDLYYIGSTSMTSTYMCYYDYNKTLISCRNYVNLILNDKVSIPNNTRFVRFSIGLIYDKPTFYLCNSGNQVINDNITNSNIDSPSGDFADIEGLIAENGVITNLLVLPVTLFSAVLNTINGQCSAMTLGSLYGTNLSLSCINIQNVIGTGLYNTIDIIISGLFVYHIGKKMIKVFNNFSSLKEGDVLDD